MTAPVVLTLDLGTSATKAALWSGNDVVATARAALTTEHPAPARAEQDATSWWTSVVDACAELRDRAPDEYRTIALVACSAARETFALFDDALRPIGPGILWSDHRAGPVDVEGLGDPDTFRRTTGVVASAGCAAAKAAWLARCEPEVFGAARWLLAPRDLVVARLTGRTVTDPSLASRTGWYALDGRVLAPEPLRSRLPDVVATSAPIPVRATPWSAAAGLGPGVDVVPGAGDRACEALGAAARPGCPMVSWGTTANVSVPHPGPVDALPTVAQVSRTDDGFLVEAGLAAAGSALDWLADLTGRPVDALWDAAATVPPGAHGVRAFPWFTGARAPHWRAEATAAFTGMRPDHTPAELARALVEGVALDVARSLELLDAGGHELVVTGGGAANPTWRAIVAATTGRRVVVRRRVEAASVGARILAARALGEPLAADTINPVEATVDPAAGERAAYVALRPAADRYVAALLARTATGIEPEGDPG